MPRLCGTWIPSVQNALMDTAVLCGQSHGTSSSHLELNSDISSGGAFSSAHIFEWKICRRPVKSLLFTIWGIYNKEMDHFDFSVVSWRCFAQDDFSGLSWRETFSYLREEEKKQQLILHFHRQNFFVPGWFLLSQWEPYLSFIYCPVESDVS